MLRKSFMFLSLGLLFVAAGCSGDSGDAGLPSDAASTTSSDSSAMASEPAASTSEQGAPTQSGFASVALPIIEAKCLGCHSGATPPKGLDFSPIKTEADAKEKAEWVKKMAEEVEEGKMPPAKGKPLTPEEKTQLLTALKGIVG